MATFHDLLEKTAFTAELGRATATFLLDLQKINPDVASEERVMLAERIRLCNDPQNLWFAKNVKDRNGERFNASGRFWQCKSVLCSGCQQLQSRSKRQRLRSVLRLCEPRSNETFQFVTLTVPNQSLSLIESHRFVDYAFSLFRKRKWFKQTFRGCVKAYEFTKTRKGLHFHVHLLALSRYISYAEIRREWTECVQKAAMNMFNRELTVHTADQLLWIVAKKVHDLDGAVFEVCKYITKSDSWTKINDESLLEYATTERLPRLFEMLGQFRVIDSELRRAARSIEANDESTDTILDKTPVSDGDSPENRETWKDYLKRYGLFYSIERLYSQFSDIKHRRLEVLEQRYCTTTVTVGLSDGNVSASTGSRHRTLADLYTVLSDQTRLLREKRIESRVPFP